MMVDVPHEERIAGAFRKVRLPRVASHHGDLGQAASRGFLTKGPDPIVPDAERCAITIVTGTSAVTSSVTRARGLTLMLGLDVSSSLTD